MTRHGAHRGADAFVSAFQILATRTPSWESLGIGFVNILNVVLSCLGAKGFRTCRERDGMQKKSLLTDAT